jgi:hypothetical protein
MSLFMAYLAHLDHAGHCYSSLNTARSWLANEFKLYNVSDPLTADPLFLKLMAGYKRGLRDRSTTRSALVWPVLRLVFEQWLAQDRPPAWVFVMTLAYVFGLRWGETQLITWPGIRCTSGTWSLVVPPFKQWDHPTVSVVPLHTVPLDARGLLLDPGWTTSLLQSVQHQDLNAAIKDTMSRLDAGHYYSVHSAKHGRATDLRVAFGMGVDDIKNILRLRSKGTAALYSGHTPKWAWSGLELDTLKTV